MYDIDYCLKKRSITGVSDECGDAGLVIDDGQYSTIALIDGLGHGPGASEIAKLAEEFVQDNSGELPTTILAGLHKHLNGTRGAVAAICRLDRAQGTLNYTGMGNINLKIYGIKSRTLVIREGIIGYIMSTPVERSERLIPGDILVLCSDGIKSHFDPVFYPDLLCGSAQQIANRIMKNLAKDNDDASCIVIKYGI